MSSEITSYPPPPDHYVEFEKGPTVLQPPEIPNFGPTYRMFGRVAQNPAHAVDRATAFTPPPIDRDVLVYDPKSPLKPQIINLINSLSGSVLDLLDAVQNKPTDTGAELRDFDTRIKSLFHALECLRPHEAKYAILALTRKEIQIRQDANTRCREVIEKARLLG